MVDTQKNPIPYYNMTPWKMIYIYIYLKKWIGRLKFKGGKGLLSRFHVVQVMKEPDWIGENPRAEPGFETDVNKQTVTRGLRREPNWKKPISVEDSTEPFNPIQFLHILSRFHFPFYYAIPPLLQFFPHNPSSQTPTFLSKLLWILPHLLPPS